MGSRIAPPLQTVFLAQVLDNTVTLLLGLLMLASGLSLFASDAAQIIVGSGAGFWLGATGLFFAIGLLYRAFFLVLSGHTLGTRLMGLQTGFDASRPATLLGLFVESLFLAAPALWALDLFARRLDRRLGLSYAFSYESFA